MNQTVVSNISKIFIVPTTPANRKEVQPGWDLDYAFKDEFIQENFALIRTLKQQQQQQQQILPTAWKVSIYVVISGPYFPVFGLNTEI